MLRSSNIIKFYFLGAVTTLAGDGLGNSGSSDGQGTSAQFNGPYGLTLDSTGTYLYVADLHNNVIRKVTTSGGKNHQVSKPTP